MLAWPDDLSRKGVLVTAFGEQIPFCDFMTRDDMLMIERKTPDTMGARQILLKFDQIVGLKITDVVKPKVFSTMGFQGGAPVKASKRRS
jgi:hypothetical protein